MKKIIGFIICTLLITVTGLSVAESIPIGTIENNTAYVGITQVKKSYIHQEEISDSPDEFIIDIIQQINETMYLGYLENITAFGPRVTGTDACNEAGDYIYNEFGIDFIPTESITRIWKSLPENKKKGAGAPRKN